MGVSEPEAPTRSRQQVALDIVRTSHRLDAIGEHDNEAAFLRRRLAELQREYGEASAA